MYSLDWFGLHPLLFGLIWFSKGWSKNVEAEIRKLKTALTEEYDGLDIKSETTCLFDAENARMQNIIKELRYIWIKEETQG